MYRVLKWQYWVSDHYFVSVVFHYVLFDFSLTVKATPHECVIRTSQP